MRLGLRAASRSPELAFGKALLDLGGTAAALLPVLLFAAVVLRLPHLRDPLAELGRLLHLARAASWPVLGALLAGALLSWVLGLAFLSGAVPLLAADAELDRRPPAAGFFTLVARGFPRVLGAGALAGGMLLLANLALSAALLLLGPALGRRPSAAALALVALLLATTLVAGVVLDALARLSLVRAAALGDGPLTAVVQGASLLGARLGTSLGITLAFLLLEALLGAALAALAGLAYAAPATVPGELLSFAPRAAVAIAAAVVFAWLEVGRQGAMAALAADQEGLLPPPPEPVRRPPAAVTVRDLYPTRPAAPPREPVVEARPAPEEPVIEALPVPEEPVVEALPAPGEPLVEALPVPAEGERPADERAPPAGGAGTGSPPG